MSFESSPSFPEIHRSFAETDFGKKLAGQVRYEKYKPQEMPNERWVKLLGADVCNLRHLQLTHGLTRVMTGRLRESQPGYLTPREEEVLEAGAMVHDWGEAIVGDINYNDKTEEDEAKEKTQLEAMIINPQANEVLADKRPLIEEALGDVIFNPDSKLGSVFNTIERVGYMRTALRANHRLQQAQADGCETNLRWLIADVLSNHTTTLMERSGLYVPVHSYLTNQSESITAAYEGTGDEVFDHYPEDQAEAKKEVFYSSYDAWQKYIGTDKHTLISP